MTDGPWLCSLGVVCVDAVVMGSCCYSGQYGVLSELLGINEEWKFLALALKIPDHQIEEIETNYPNNVSKCWEKMVKKWLKGASQSSWSSLCAALRDPLVSHHDIANAIQCKYPAANNPCQ